MSHPPLLPQTVRIKRKRQDEPVDTLHVHTQDDSKRRRHTANSKQSPGHQAQAVFRRVQEVQDRISETAATGTDTAAADAASSGGASVNYGQPSGGSRPPPSSACAASLGPPSGSVRGHEGGGGGTTGGSSGRRILAPGPQATRRFHLARSSHHRNLSSSGGSLATGPAGGVKKRKNVATLVESKPKKYRSDEYLNPALNEYVARREEEKTGVAASPLKRPGKSSAVSTPRKASSTATTNTPSEAALQQQASAHANTNAAAAALNAANAVDPGLLADMQRFAYEVETAEQPPAASKLNTNIAFAPGTPSMSSSSTPQKLKFQPKPTQRFRERNPLPPTAALGAMDIDPASSSSSSASDSDSDPDAGDYVYDTYIRSDGPSEAILHDAMSSAATAATAHAVPAHPLPPSVGLLVIAVDEQPLWEAYAEDDGDAAAADDAEAACDTDDEDSNAEDWRGNEYPDEEDDDEGSDSDVGAVAAWGRRAKGLPVEDEEWDARGMGMGGGDSDSDSDAWGERGDAATWSDEEEARMRRPFAVPGWLKR